jgi:hypothetical protein
LRKKVENPDKNRRRRKKSIGTRNRKLETMAQAVTDPGQARRQKDKS